MGIVVGPLLLVDAANVVGSRPDGWWRDRPGAAAALLAALAAWEASDGRLPGGVVVRGVHAVLEGGARDAAAPGPWSPPDGRGEVVVVHAAASGDEVLAASCAPGVLLVTGDRDLRRRARGAGADLLGAATLRDVIEPWRGTKS